MEHFREPGFLQDQERVPPVPRALGHRHLGGVHAPEQRHHGPDQLRVGVDVAQPRVGLHQVRLDEDAPAPERPRRVRQGREPRPEDLLQVHVVAGRGGDEGLGRQGGGAPPQEDAPGNGGAPGRGVFQKVPPGPAAPAGPVGGLVTHSSAP